MKKRKPKIWTPERKAKLKELAELGFRYKVIAQRLGLTENQIKVAMSNFKLRNNRGPLPIPKSKLGHRPKGVNPFSENPNPPVPDGSVSPDGTEIKINGKWIRHSRYLWEKLHGPVPDGYVIRKIDRSGKIEEGNLKLVSKKENALLNHDVEKMRQSIIRLHKERKGFNKPKYRSDTPWYLKKDPVNQDKSR